MSEVKSIQEDLGADSFDLAAYAFNLPRDEMTKKRFDFLFNKAIPLGTFHQQQIKSQLLLFPLEVVIHGEVMPMGGIGYVSSYPETRGKGYVKQLFVKTLAEMNHKGMVLSYLDPFSYPFYRKFGYELSFNQVQYEIGATDMPRVESYLGSMERTDWESSKELLKQLYAEKTASSVGPVKRPDWIWESDMMRNKQERIALYKDTDQEVKGYLCYHADTEVPNRFIIDELVYLTQEAFVGVWQFIASHQSTFDTFLYTVKEEEYFLDLFPNPRIKNELKPFMMARIVNIETFLKQFPFKDRAQKTFYLRIIDEYAGWNDGLWRVELRKTGRQMTKVVDESVVNETEILSATIQTWTQLFLNYRTMENLYFHQKMFGNAAYAKELADRIPEGAPQLFNYF